MVQLMKPTLKDKILDPAMGSAGFLLESSIYVSAHYTKELMKADNAKYYKSECFPVLIQINRCLTTDLRLVFPEERLLLEMIVKKSSINL